MVEHIPVILTFNIVIVHFIVQLYYYWNNYYKCKPCCKCIYYFSLNKRYALILCSTQHCNVLTVLTVLIYVLII